MSQDFYSIEQVAVLLGLHVRTVRNYVRDGALKAVKIGKQYRIARADLEAMTGKPVADAVRRQRHVEVSSIVEIDAIGVDAANRMTNYLMAAAKSRPKDDQPLRIETMYDEERARLKIVLMGGVETSADLLRFIATTGSNP
jgi:excisionase family DNA binding protein